MAEILLPDDEETLINIAVAMNRIADMFDMLADGKTPKIDPHIDCISNVHACAETWMWAALALLDLSTMTTIEIRHQANRVSVGVQRGFEF